MAPRDDESTEPAWDDLVPREHNLTWFNQRAQLTIGTEGQGFVRYPAKNPEIRAVSAVHQLHCLVSQKS